MIFLSIEPTWYHYFILFLFAHFLADYPLQGDFMANAKNPNTPLGKVYWLYVLPAHAGIHAGFVFLITGIWWLFVLELVAHALIDYAKCVDSWRIFNFNFEKTSESKAMFIDQMLHLVCKIIWTIVVMVYFWKV